MIGHRGCLYFLMVSMCLQAGAFGVGEQPAEAVFSQGTAELFARQAERLHEEANADPQKIEQAMTFLDAALALDETCSRVPEQILRIAGAARYAETDYSKSVYWALQRQVGPAADLTALNGAVAYLLTQQNSRLDREVLLEMLMKKYGLRNETFGSDLAAQMGLLSVEKADLQTATEQLAYACQLNCYNQLAFAKLQELYLAQNLSVTATADWVNLRTALDMNPYDLDLAVAYAERLCGLQWYGPAAAAYDYAARVFELVAADEPLNESIYAAWLLCAYQAPRQETELLDIVERYRAKGRFSLLAEAVAAKTEMKLGQAKAAQRRLDAAAKKAEQMLANNPTAGGISPEQLSWFYGFVLDEPDAALAWANRANKQTPDRPAAAAMFAYALIQNGRVDLAKEYAEPYEKTSQTAALTLALVARAQQDQATAIARLKSAIAMAPETLEAEKAMRLLNEQGGTYVPPSEATSLRKELETEFEKRLVPGYLSPRERLSAKLDLGGGDLAYGIELEPKLVLENRSSSPLVIGPGGMLGGRLRADARISGDLNVAIDAVFDGAFRPSRAVLPHEHVTVPLSVEGGKLARILQTYPQADLEIQLTVYLDPVVAPGGRVENALTGLEPVSASVKRPGVSLTRDFLMQRLDALGKGRPGQQSRAVRLFAGLLAEQKAFAAGGTSFQYVQVDQPLLVDSVRRALKDDSWKLRVEAMDALLTLSVPLDGTLVKDVSANLDHDKWPVRMAAMVLLAKAQPQTFQPVLDWTARQDPFWLNRRMAVALGGQPAEKEGM